MNKMQTVTRYLGICVITVVVAAPISVCETYAETYVAGQIGVTLPSVLGSGLGEGDLTGVFNPGTTISPQELQKSILYGGRVGHYFRAVPWFGLEFEVYRTTPHIKQQSLTFSGPSGPVGTLEFPGLNFSVLTIAPINVAFRYHKSRLQPYVGFGPGIFFARIKDPSLATDNSQSSATIGLNAYGGLRYYITRNIAVFGEGKFNYARFSFDETPAGPSFNLFGFDATYKVFHASFGVSFHF